MSFQRKDAETAREYAETSEEHARKILKAYRNSLQYNRIIQKTAEEDAARILVGINEAKRVMYEKGWSEAP